MTTFQINDFTPFPSPFLNLSDEPSRQKLAFVVEERRKEVVVLPVTTRCKTISTLPTVTVKTECAFDAGLRKHNPVTETRGITDEELRKDMHEALVCLPSDKFISTRALTYLDVIIASACKKYGSVEEITKIFRDTLASLPEKETRYSKQTKEFLENATLSDQNSSLRALLTKKYLEDLESELETLKVT